MGATASKWLITVQSAPNSRNHQSRPARPVINPNRSTPWWLPGSTAWPGPYATCRTSSTTFNNVALKATEQPIDTSTAAGKCFLDMLGVFAEFETNLRRERQMEGIARAKASGVYAGKGRPSSIDAAQVREMKAQALGATAIAKALGIGRASVYPVLEADSI
jgi:hypothetical protein